MFVTRGAFVGLVAAGGASDLALAIACGGWGAAARQCPISGEGRASGKR